MRRFKYLGSKKKISLFFNYYYQVLLYEFTYKNPKLTAKTSDIVYSIQARMRAGLFKFYSYAWIKFFLIFYRNMVGFSLPFYKRMQVLFASFTHSSYMFYIFFDFVRFVLFEDVYAENRIFFSAKHVTTGQQELVTVYFLDYLPLRGPIFRSFFDGYLKHLYFGTFFKDRALYLDDVSYISPFYLFIYFFKGFSSSMFFSYLGVYFCTLHKFYVDNSTKFVYRVSIK